MTQTPEIILISATKTLTIDGGSRVTVRSQKLGQQTLAWDYEASNPLRAAVEDYLSRKGHQAQALKFDHETTRGNVYRAAITPTDALEATP